MRTTDKATDKQLGMLSYTIRSNFPHLLLSQKDERGGEMKYQELIDWAGENLDKYQVSGFINILSDEDLDEKWRSDFLVQYLKAKGFEGV